MAFLIDLLLFSVGTIGCVSILFEVGGVKPSALTSMAIVWMWFLLFVLLDWAFTGTPGKHIMGLRLKGVPTEGAAKFLFDCLARNLLTFVVPLSLAGRILSIVKVRDSVEWAAAAAILSFCPLSIVFFDGQSLPDLLVGITVLPRKSHEVQSSASLSRQKWLWLVLASLLVGVAWGFTPSMDRSGLFKGNQLRQPATSQYYVSSEAEMKMASGLWPYVQAGIAEGLLRDVRVYSAVGKLPALAGEEPEAGTPCQEAYRAKRTYKIIRLQIHPATPIVVVNSLFGNMPHTTDRFVGRPGLMVIELSTRRSFGVFNLDLPEEYVFCFAGSDKAPEPPILVGASRSVQPSGSFNELGWLFLGDLGDYSYVEKVPVYPW